MKFASAYVVSFGLLLVCAFGLFVNGGAPNVMRPKTGDEEFAHQQKEDVDLSLL